MVSQTEAQDEYRALVLAAGRGTRFPTEPGSSVPKVLRPVLGKPLIGHVLQVLRRAGVRSVTVIVGFGADQVRDAIMPGYDYVLQLEQKGSGHAVACAKDRFEDFDGPVVVMCGDSPLFRSETLGRMLDHHRQTGAAATLAAAVLDDPTGYGRIIRSDAGQITGVVEEKCVDERERAIEEVNGGAYVFDSKWLFANIGRMARNEAREYNLTDMIRVAVEQGRTVASVECAAEEIAGVNTPEELEAVEQVLRSRGTE